MASIDQQLKQELRKQEKRKRAIQHIDSVIKHPSGSPKRWRAAFEHFLKQRPEAAPEAHAIAEMNKERRQTMNKFGDVKFGRLVMSAPSYLNDVIRITDPEYFIEFKQEDLTKPHHLRKLKEAFPEYFLPKEI